MENENRARWMKLVADLEVSGLTQREFAQERGISFYGLRNWLYRSRKERKVSETKEDKVSRDSSLRLIPVEVVGSAPNGAARAMAEGIELVLSSGTRLRFPAGTDVNYVKALVGAL
jgi:hypothetical protein